MSLNSRKKFITPGHLFILISISGILIFFILSFFYGNSIVTWLVQENNPSEVFCDYFMHLRGVRDPQNVYSTMDNDAGCFPPLAYVMYYLLYRINRSSLISDPGNLKSSVQTLGSVLLTYEYFIILTAAVFLTAFVLWNRKNRSRIYMILVFICIMFSAPFYGSGYFVGNSSMLVLGLMLISLYWKDSSSAWKRELSLILIAICAGIKIYPAIFGFLYIKEKRWKEAVRLVLYGILFFFGPFVFFGGVNGFLLWLGNVQNTLGRLDYGRIECIKGAVYTVLSWFHRGVENESVNLAADIAPYIFLILMLVLSFISRNRIRVIFFLSSLMTFFATNSFRYTLGYLTIPLIIWLLDDPSSKEGGTCCDYIRAVLNGLLFTIPVWWGAATHFALTTEYFSLTYVQLYCYLTAYLLLFFETITEIAEQVRQRHGHKSEGKEISR